MARRVRSVGPGTLCEALERRRLLASYVVNVSADEMDGNWSAGDLSLREAIALSNEDEGADEITFAPGLSGTTLILSMGTLIVDHAVSILGPGAESLTVSGDGAAQVFYFSPISTTAELSGLTITGGRSNLGGAIRNFGSLTLRGVVISGNESTGSGGGIYNDRGALVLEDSIISGNTSASGGGGIFSVEGAVTVTRSTISGNNSGSGGGGILGSLASITITDSAITGNSATDGGGIHQIVRPITVINSRISDNSATGSGGGIYAYVSAGVNMTGSTVAGNSADRGGGIEGLAGSLRLTDSTVSGNRSATSGGGIYWASGAVTVSASTVSGNSASTEGGGIATLGTTLEVLSSTVSGNTADSDGGGIWNDGAVLTIKNSTVTANTAASEGGGLYQGDAATDASMISAILSGNSSPADADLRGTLQSISHSILGADAMLAPLADNGGPTRTHALLEGSPAIDAGSNPDGLAYDQRGGRFLRARDDKPDIGAYERQTLELIVDTDADESDGDFTEGDLSLREAVVIANASPEKDLVSFDDSLENGRIVLAGSWIRITDALEIRGPAFEPIEISGAKAQRHFEITDSQAGTRIEVSLSWLRLVEGYAPADGGSILNRESLALTNVRITENAADGDGGAIVNYAGILTIDSCIISHNTAGDSGGAIDNDGTGVVTIIGSSIANNLAGGTSGAVDNDLAGTLVITSSGLFTNAAGTAGGAIDNLGDLTISESTAITSNRAPDGGGAIRHALGTLVIEGTRLAENSTEGDGGALLILSGAASLFASTISDNLAEGRGGAIRNLSTLKLANVTISSNQADVSGAGISNGGGELNILNSTITAGRAPTGGGIEVEAGSVRAISTIVAGNTATNAAADVLGQLAGDSTNNLIGDADSSGGLVDGADGNIVGADPLLGPLQDNDGFTLTHALLPGSPAIDAGSNPAEIETDQRGAARSRGGAPDIGAFEATARPLLGALEASATEIIQGEEFTLAANGATDPDGTIAEVRFYVDRDGDSLADESELLGSDADGSDGYTLAVTRALSLGLGSGSVRLLAVSVDNEDSTSVARSAGISVLFSVLAPDGSLVRGTSSAGDRLWVGARNEAGDPIVFDVASGDVHDLAAGIGAPRAVDDLVVWTDPKDGLVYAAYPSEEGLIILQRAADGAWSLINLSTQVEGVGGNSPVRALTQFVSTAPSGAIVVVAGIDASGDLVAFRQTGAPSGNGWAWTFVDISDDLDSQGMATPEFDELISYVTPWNAWNIAGIDAAGDIQGVWIAPASFSKWRVDNLSRITGAPPLDGQLTVTQTAWSAINLGGVNHEGRLVVTWWIPRFEGRWVTSDLTTAAGGEPLTPGLATGFVTPWGAINYAGLDSEGQVRAYWWTPGTNRWQVSTLTGNAPASQPRPVGVLTSTVSAQGTMSILGRGRDGEVVRLWWLANDDGRWKLADLSAQSTRA